MKSTALTFALAAMASLSSPALLGAQRLPEQFGTVRADIPFLDAPYNLRNGGRAPSMAQSVAVTESFYELAHAGIQRTFGSHTVLSGFALVTFDVFGGLLPGGDAWVHEEFHRAALGNRGVGSFDDIYKLNLLADVVNVSHVQDADLIRLKAEHPTEFVRAAEAGIEGENQLMERLEKNRFFQGSRANNVALYWLSKINSVFYVWSGATSEADSITDEANRLEGANVQRRDWVGHDFTAWVHDLHHPTEAYEARGLHPSGIGIDRYLGARDLSPEERDFLEREGKLQLLNLLDGNLLAWSGITLGSGGAGSMKLNATASHYLTSFGHTIDMNVFLRDDAKSLFVVLHRYTNAERSLPGIDVQLIDARVLLAGRQLDISPRVSLWMQPRDQAFRTSAAQGGGLLSVRVRPATTGPVATFVEVEGKTAGWVAGNVNLDHNLSVRVGGSVRLQ